MTSKLGKKILDTDDSCSEVIDVPEWQVKVRVCGLTGAQRDKLDVLILSSKDGRSFAGGRARIAAWCCRDPESGELIFEESDIPMIEMKNAAVLDRIFNAVARISMLGEEGLELARKKSEAESEGLGSD